MLLLISALPEYMKTFRLKSFTSDPAQWPNTFYAHSPYIFLLMFLFYNAMFRFQTLQIRFIMFVKLSTIETSPE